MAKAGGSSWVIDRSVPPELLVGRSELFDLPVDRSLLLFRRLVRPRPRSLVRAA